MTAHAGLSCDGGREGQGGRPNGARPAKPTGREQRVLDMILAHLREARENDAIGKMTFELEFARGGIKGCYIGLNVSYRFMENMTALDGGPSPPPQQRQQPAPTTPGVTVEREAGHR